LDLPLTFANRLWAIEPRWFAACLEALGNPRANADPERFEAARAASRNITPTAGVAVISIHGPITHRPDPFLGMFGFDTLSSIGIQDAFRSAIASPDVRGIVFDIDSPGGEVAGTAELAKAVRSARGTKPIVAVANTMAASAAYWLASQTDQIFVTPSGEVGSIGVIGLRWDMTAAAEAEGIRAHIITAGKYKAEGHPLLPADDGELADMQAMADTHYQAFTADVARGRRVPVETVRSGYGEGRMLLAKAAVKAGMADREGTLDDAIRAVAGGAVEARALAVQYEGHEGMAATRDQQVDPDVFRRLWDIARA